MRIAILAVLALAGCASTPPAGTSAGVTPSTVSYGCVNVTTMVATFKEGAVDLRMANGDVITLPQAVSASGSRYATPQHEFWIKGDEATYTIGRMVPTTCRVAK